MISGINIKDFAIVKELSVDLKPGLNIITGETGAGKSVIIEAISMALGSRADTAYVRTGCDKAVVTLIIDTEDCELGSILEEMGVQADDPMIIRREISAQSKSVCRVNGTIVPLSALNLLCKKIADIHGQYDQQILLDPDNHLEILDLYGGKDLRIAKEDTAKAFAEYAEYSNAYYKLKKELSDAERQRDFLRFELAEITSADIKPGEDEALEDSIRIMENGERLYEAVSTAHLDLYDAEYSADSTLGNAIRSLEAVRGISPEIDKVLQRVYDVYYELDDMNTELRNARESVNFSQRELDANIERLETINKLKRKYGGSIEKVLEYARKAENSLSDIENADEKMRELEENIKSSKELVDHRAEGLSKMRHTAAERLENLVDNERSELNFSNAHFKVFFTKTNSSALGIDGVEFLIATNRGEVPKALAKIASGGELSRIMLALKSIIGDLDEIPTMIFDEIDTGISGATAAVVGDKLVSIAKNHQVICITHLPQIASRGESHYRIEKVSDEISTHTTGAPSSEEERIEELARLLSGTVITDTARMQAKELLGSDE